MEVEDAGGVVLTAYHSYARSQPPSSEPRCTPRGATSHPGSRYRQPLRREQGFPGLRDFTLQLGFLPGNTTTRT
ncbi:Rho GTPase-activating protein 28 [Pteropus alecto]|uniref:Rho GTPase-activating protein 28 n=1 Tax=Pteropus alecto TaxID=9402 RepID=L5K4P0_PTEAL|nr:Rho GTPase-activating protein 28 [Pteropus alecto]